jgi:hypothetical protein
MPRINPEKMIESLTTIHLELQAILCSSEGRAEGLCDAIRKQMEYIERLITTIEKICE